MVLDCPIWCIDRSSCSSPFNGVFLCIILHSRSISFASQAGNYILILVMIVVIVYGALHNKPDFSVSMLWPRNVMDIANMFGVICFSMGVAFVGLSSRV